MNQNNDGILIRSLHAVVLRNKYTRNIQTRPTICFLKISKRNISHFRHLWTVMGCRNCLLLEKTFKDIKAPNAFGWKRLPGAGTTVSWSADFISVLQTPTSRFSLQRLQLCSTNSACSPVGDYEAWLKALLNKHTDGACSATPAT